MTFSIMILVEANSAQEAIAKRGEGRVHAVALTKQFSKPLPIENVEPKQWPLWAKALRILAIPDDKGIGDVIARVIGVETSEAFEAWHVKTFGRKCNCKGRRERWNRLYPLG